MLLGFRAFRLEVPLALWQIGRLPDTMAKLAVLLTILHSVALVGAVAVIVDRLLLWWTTSLVVGSVSYS